MKTTTRNICALVLSGAALFTANAANATCSTGWVNVTQVITSTNAAGTPYAYVYSIPEHALGLSLPTFLYYTYTTDQSAINQASRALQNHEALLLFGDAGSCPSTGTYRNIGTLQTLYDY